MAEHEVNTTELASSFGVTPQQIINYWHEGMPKLSRGTWNLGACWKWRYDRQALELETARQESPDDLANRDLEDALLKRTQREIKEIELAKLRGEIVDVGQVEKVLERAVSAFRNRMLAIPTKSAPRVFGAEDVNQVKGILDADVSDALGELSRIASDLGAIREIAQAGIQDSHTSAETDREPVGRQRKVPKPRSKRRARKVADRSG
jgi:phage terminase Nu1 subunit (DNA packaging protein)